MRWHSVRLLGQRTKSRDGYNAKSTLLHVSRHSSCYLEPKLLIPHTRNQCDNPLMLPFHNKSNLTELLYFFDTYMLLSWLAVVTGVTATVEAIIHST